MLEIVFTNVQQDGVIADYRYEVHVNRNFVADGIVRKYDRRAGWEGLVKRLADQLTTPAPPEV